MKLDLFLLKVVACIASAPLSGAQTPDWGSETFRDLVGSDGITPDNTFVFERGAFAEGFVPDESNVDSWISNLRVFDQAAYNLGIGYLTSTANMLDHGTSDSPYQCFLVPGFEGLGAYLWVCDGDNAVEGAKRLLAQADNRVFSNSEPGSRGTKTPVRWSVSSPDGGDAAVFESRNGVSGAGEFTATVPHTLQALAIVPEPGSAILSVLGMSRLCFRRRRES